MSKKAKRILADALLFAAILGLTLYAVFRGRDLGDIREAIQDCDGRWLIPAFLCVLLFIGGESVILRLLLGSGGYRLGLGRCFLVSSAGFFFSAVTPSAGGGQPMQVYFLSREKVPVPVSAVMLMAVTITYKLVLVIVALGLTVFRFDFIRDHFGGMMVLYWLGFGLTAGFVAVLLTLVFHPDLARRMVNGAHGLAVRLHLMRHSEKRHRSLLDAMEKYHETAAYFRTHMGLMVLVLAITFAQRFALFTVPWLVYRGFGLTGYSWASVAGLQALIAAAADMLPLPGGMGVTEALFLTVFEPVFGALTLPGMVLSRGVEFYCRLAVSAAFTAVAAAVLGRHRREREEGAP